MAGTPTTAAVPDWQLTLQRLAVRNGALELMPADAAPADAARIVQHEDGGVEATHQVAWRVRLLRLEPSSIIVERPSSTHQPVVIKPGDSVIGIVLEGSTRWSLTMSVVEQFHFNLNGSQSVIALRLTWPRSVTNAQRREFFRVETAAAIIPPVSCWRLGDAASATEYERYSELLHKPVRTAEPPPKPHFPQLTNPFNGRLIDLSGGGLCLAVARTHKPLVDGSPLLWVTLSLPGIDMPYHAVARPAHAHVESPMILHVGLAFSFEHNPPHQRFIIDHLCRFATQLQRLQLQRTR